MKGVYQSIRLAEVPSSVLHVYAGCLLHIQGKRLVVNVDVSNSCFWHPTNFSRLAFNLSGEKDERGPGPFQVVASRQSDGREAQLLPMLKRLVRNKFYVRHRGSDGKLNCAPPLRSQHY